MRFTQTCALESFPTLRQHKLNLLFLNKLGKQVAVRSALIQPQQITTLKFDIQGVEAIFPNYQDYGYIKLVFGEKNSQFFKKNLKLIEDGLTQVMIVRSFYDQVRDGTLKATQFVRFLVREFFDFALGSTLILKSVLEFLHASCFTYTPQYLKHQYA